MFTQLDTSHATALSHETWPRGFKTSSTLNSVEHEILNAHKYKNIKKFVFLGSFKHRMVFLPLIHVKINCWHLKINEQEKTC